MAPQHMQLSGISYSNSEQLIVVDFEGVEKEFKFFPKVFYPAAGLSEQNFKNFADLCGCKPSHISVSEDSAALSFDSFSDLKSFVLSMQSVLKFRPVVLEPERQFLIDKRWGYFDFFEKESDHPMSSSIEDFLPENILPNILRVPVNYFVGRKMFAKIFMQNLFFGSNIALSDETEMVRFSEKGLKGFSQIDFSGVVCAVCAVPNNISLSAHCSCCRPSSLDDDNILPSTTVEVLFLRDGVFFDSASKLWADKFHNSKPMKNSRSRMRIEYNLGHFPVGPFFRGSREHVLICDAKMLAHKGFAQILGPGVFSWKCRRKESFFAHEINNLRKMSAGGFSQKQQAKSNGSMLEYAAVDSHICDLAGHALGIIPVLLSLEGSKFFRENASYNIDSFANAVCTDLVSAAQAEGIALKSFGTKLLLPPSYNASFAANAIFRLYNFEKGLLKVNFAPK